jgi:hypothetical protein
MKVLNPTWMENKDKRIAAYKQAVLEGRTPEKIVEQTACNQAIQWLILRLTREGISFRLVQLGAGVKMVTTETDLCPKCHGTGRY